MSGKWWLLRAGGAGELGEAAEGHGAAGKVHLSRTRQKKWAKIGPLSPFSSCPRISQSGQGARAALWAALWPDPGRPGRPGGPAGRPSGRPFFEGRPERRPFFCKGRPHFEGGRPAATRAAPRPPWAAHRPSGGHIRAALNLRVAALRAARRPRRGGPAARSGRPILGGGRPLLVGGPPDFGRRAARFGGWAAPVAAGRPAHHLRPIRPLTGHRFL